MNLSLKSGIPLPISLMRFVDSAINRWLRQLGGNKASLVEFLNFGGSTAIQQLVRFFVFFIAARQLGPEKFGFWSLLTLLFTYGYVFQLGIINGMNRDVPYWKGRGDLNKVEAVRSNAFSFMLISSMVVGLSLMFMSLVIDLPTERRIVYALIGVAFLNLQLYNYIQISFKSDMSFHDVAFQQYMFTGVFLASSLPFLFSYGLIGLVMAYGLTYAVTNVFFIYRRKICFDWSLELQEIRRLIEIGFPILLAGVLFGLLITLDRWLILTYLGEREVGLYSVVAILFSGISLVPDVISNQIYPRMALLYGQTGRYHDIRGLIRKQGYLSFISTGLLICLICLIYPKLVEMFLPQYVESINVVYTLAPGLLILSFAGGYGNFLNSVGRQTTYLLVQIAAIVFNVICITLVLNLSPTLPNVGLAVSIAYAMYSLLLVFVGNRVLSRDKVMTI